MNSLEARAWPEACFMDQVCLLALWDLWLKESAIWFGDRTSASYDWSEAAQPGDRTGPNPTRKSSLGASRAVLRCNRIQLDAEEAGPTSPVFLLGDRKLGERQQGISGSRNTFDSSSADAMPSGRVPRLYSAMRFFHLRKSVMLCGSMRTSTRRRLARSRFIS
jgi:hypothetical protein